MRFCRRSAKMLRRLLFLLAFCCPFSSACTDHKGRARKNGEQWDNENGFLLQCELGTTASTTWWRTKVVACLAPGLQIPLGQTITQDDVQYECRQTSTGALFRTKSAGWKIKSVQTILPPFPGGSYVTPATNVGVGYQTTRKPIPPGGSYLPRTTPGPWKPRATPKAYVTKSATDAAVLRPVPSTGTAGRFFVKCYDSTGTPRKVGEFWVEKNSFVMTCTSMGNNIWQVRTVACLTSQGTRIPVGETQTEDGKKYTCTMEGDYGRLKIWGTTQHPATPGPGTTRAGSYLQPGGGTRRPPRCLVDYRPLAVGEEMVYQGRFIVKCISDGHSDSIACLSPQNARIEIDQMLTEGDMKYTCVRSPGGLTLNSARVGDNFNPVNIPSYGFVTPAPCTPGTEKRHMQGTYGGFITLCVEENGITKMKTIACISPEGDKVPIGQQVQKGTNIYVCLVRGRAHQTVLRVFGLPRTGPTPKPGTLPPPRATTAFSLNTQNWWWMKECKFRGYTKKNGEEWRAGDFYVRCEVKNCTGIYCSQVAVEPIACSTPGGEKIPPGENRTESHRWFGCTVDATGRMRLRIELLHSWLNQQYGKPGQQNGTNSGVPKTPPGASQFGFQPGATAPNCPEPCRHNLQTICSGQSTVTKSYLDGKALVACEKGQLEKFCAVKTAGGEFYKLTQGQYTKVQEQLLICAMFDDSKGQLEPSVQADRPQFRDLLDRSSYVEIQAKIYN